jgi:hypothetical protein
MARSGSHTQVRALTCRRLVRQREKEIARSGELIGLKGAERRRIKESQQLTQFRPQLFE